MTKKKQSNAPTMRAYLTTGEGENTNWREIGALWPHKDGNGFNLKLDAIPRGDAAIVIRAVQNKA